MPTHSDPAKCPNCLREGDQLVSATIFIPIISFYCIHCGIEVTQVVKYSDLDDLNYRRGEKKLEPLEKLPPQTINSCGELI